MKYTSQIKSVFFSVFIILKHKLIHYLLTGVEETDSVIGLAAGLGTGVALLVVITIAIGIIFRKRISKKKGKYELKTINKTNIYIKPKIVRVMSNHD